jgi:archaellum component FlaC
MNEIISEQLPAIITGILGLGAYLFEKRRKNAEIQQVESDAITAMQNAYKTFVADSNNKYEELRKELELSRKETAQSRIEIQELKQEIEEWQKKYEAVLEELRSFEKGNNTTPAP